MAITLEALAKRVDELEQEVAELKQRDAAPRQDESELQRVIRELGYGTSNRDEVIAIAKRVFRGMGIPEDPPMTIEELHRSMLASGIRPEDNILSRGIIEARNATRGPDPKE